MPSSENIHINELEDYFHCPKYFEFEYHSSLSGDGDQSEPSRIEFLKSVVCEAVDRAINSKGTSEDHVESAFDEKWPDYYKQVKSHSEYQSEFESALLRSGVINVCESIIDDHGIKQANSLVSSSVVGPDLTLSVDSQVGNQYQIPVDYLEVVDGKLNAIRLAESFTSLGIPYSGQNMTEKYFDEGQYRPDGLVRVFETYLTEQWIKNIVQEESCRPGSLVYISLLEDYHRAGNDANVEPDVRMGRSHFECDDTEIREWLETATAQIRDQIHDPSEFFSIEPFDTHSFDSILEEECEDCKFRVGCSKRIQQEVMFHE